MEAPSSPSDRVALIFDQARQLAEAAREAYLREACKGDSELRRLIGDLLATHKMQGDFLAEPTHALPPVAVEGPAAADKAGEATTELPASASGTPASTQIGRYKLLQRIGEGGFGEVWMAEQRVPIKRRVALKIIKPGMDSRQVIARFEAERQALAMMDHPNIARVFDAGVTDAGRPYFVMELVRGVPITEYADRESLDAQARLELFANLCNAVQHAHQKGIIHRDIKPSNVLVTVTDGKPVPKVIDFGIAKATCGELTDKTLFTEFRQFIGTPQYMSPEQAGMSGVDIDTRSDVYSLGVLLYELLTGVTPFDATRLRSAALEEMRRIIREEDPPRPSTRVSILGEALAAVARHRRIEPARLGALIRGDLDWITMKCLEKDRGRRYGTANELAADVQRHLAGEGVVAAPPSRIYRMRKFARKHRGPVFAAGLVTGALLLGVIGTSAGLIFARAEEQRATTEAQRASRIARFLQSTLFGAGSPEELSANRDVLRELIASAASSSEVLDPQRWPNVRLALRLIEGHWRETPPSTTEFSRVLTEMLNVAVPAGDQHSNSVARDLAEHNARGVLFVLTGKLGEAEEVFRAALELTDNPSDHQARLARAEQLVRVGLVDGADGFQEALAILRAEHGNHQLATAEVAEALATSLWRPVSWRKGHDYSPQFREAQSLLEECLETRRATPGVAPESIARVQTSLADIHQNWHQDPCTAVAYLREALIEWKRAFPGEHANVANALVKLGGVLRLVNPLESQRILNEALEMIERLDSRPTERKGTALRFLADAHNRNGQFTLAANTAEQALKTFEVVRPVYWEDGRTHWSIVVHEMRGYCRRLAATDEPAAAKSYYRKLLALTTAHPDFHNDEESKRSVRTEFRDFLQWYGQRDEARAIIPDLSIIRIGSENQPYATRLADELEQIAEARLAAGDYASAERWYERCLDWREQNAKTLDVYEKSGAYDAYFIPLTQGHIGWTFMKQGRYAEAERLMVRPCESMFPDHLRSGARRVAIERLISLYETWQRDEPALEHGKKAAKWRERLARLEFAAKLGEYLNFENIRALLVKTSGGDALNFDEWKRARTFVRFMTGDWNEDPMTAVPFNELVVQAVRTVDMQKGAGGNNVVVEPDKTSIDYIVSHAALCVLDGRWTDADALLSRAIQTRAPKDDSDDLFRLLSSQAALKEMLGQTGLAHSLYRRIANTLEARPSIDPKRIADAIIDAARTSPTSYSGESEKVAVELRRALDLISLRLPADNPRLARCLLELATSVQAGNALPACRQDQADSLFNEAIGRLETQSDTRPLLLAEALRRSGVWLLQRWHEFPPFRAVATLERAAVLYRTSGLTDSPQLADTLENLGRAYWNDCRCKEAAEALCESAELRLALGEVGLGETPGHDAGVIPAITACGDCLAVSDDLPNAERIYRAAASIAERDAAGAYTARDARVRLRQFLLWSGRADEAETVFDAETNWFGTGLSTNSYEDNLAERCRDIAAHLLKSREPTDAIRAAQFVRRGVRILESGERAAWRKHCFASLLGDAFVVQGKFDEAEPMLLTSYEGLRSDPNTPETSGGQDRQREALERIVRMYETWHLAEPEKGADSKAAEWRARMENTASASSPALQP